MVPKCVAETHALIYNTQKPELFMNEEQEEFYTQGQRAVWLSFLQECLKNLGYHSPETGQAKWILEREETIAKLRELCGEFGDNDWDASLHLADILEKHLAKYLYE